MENKELSLKNLWFDCVLFFGLSINKLINYINTGKTGLLINSYAELIIIAVLLSVLCSKLFLIYSEKYTLVGKRKLLAGIMMVVLLFATVCGLLVGWMYLVNYNPRNQNLLYEIILEEDAPYVTGVIGSLAFALYYFYKSKIQIIDPEIDYCEVENNLVEVEYELTNKDDERIDFWRKVYQAECEGHFDTDHHTNPSEDTKSYKIICNNECVGYFLTRNTNNRIEIFEGYVSGFVRNQMIYYYQAVLEYLNTLEPGMRIELTNLSLTKSTYKKLEFDVMKVLAKEHCKGKNYDILCDNNGMYRIVMKARGEQSEIED